jgi:hypothetical protein
MKLEKNFKKSRLLAVALVLLSFAVVYAQEQYTFKVRNVGQNKVLKLMASQDGKNWGYFDIGEGIEPGETMTVAWDKSTNNQSCTQFFKAAFDDGEESPPKKFDFCEKNLVIDVK